MPGRHEGLRKGVDYDCRQHEAVATPKSFTLITTPPPAEQRASRLRFIGGDRYSLGPASLGQIGETRLMRPVSLGGLPLSRCSRCGRWP